MSYRLQSQLSGDDNSAAITDRYDLTDIDGDGGLDFFVWIEQGRQSRSSMTASFEGESIRLTGAIDVSPWGQGVDQNGDAQSHEELLHSFFLPHGTVHPSNFVMDDQIEFDATIGTGQSLLLELDDLPDGSKQLLLIKASR